MTMKSGFYLLGLPTANWKNKMNNVVNVTQIRRRGEKRDTRPINKFSSFFIHYICFRIHREYLIIYVIKLLYKTVFLRISKYQIICSSFHFVKYLLQFLFPSLHVRNIKDNILLARILQGKILRNASKIKI